MEDLKSADDLPRCPDDELKVLPSRKSLNPYSEIVLVMLFIISISLPTARMALPGYSNHWSAAEQATLAPFPKIGPDLATIKAFPHSFKRYFQENFGFRKPLLYWHGVFKYSWLKVSSSPFVILGQGGWLFFADEASMESLRCSKPFTNEQLAQWKRTLELRNEVLSKDGMKYLVVVVPDKHTIYPEYVPSAYARINEKSRREQLIEYLEANSRLAIIDLTEPLKKAKTANEIYFRTDTHWNDLGAFVAYQEIGRQIGNWYPQIQLRSRSEFNLAHAVSKSGDLARMLGLE